MYCEYFMSLSVIFLNITIISDSKRHGILSNELIKDGYSVKLYKTFNELPSKIKGDIVVLPIPTLKKDQTVNFNGCSITIEELIDRIDKNCLIISCNYSTDIRSCIDINKYEPFISMNAIPSAEGAIFEAVKNSDITLFDSKCLVIGYGRIGKIIADRLKGFGANVWVTARNHKDEYSAKSRTFGFIEYDELNEKISDFDFIFQTVPYLILDKERLDKTYALIIELASNGIGTDINYAKEKNKNVIYAPAIPEKYSPKSAGKIFHDSVISIIKELNI